MKQLFSIILGAVLLILSVNIHAKDSYTALVYISGNQVIAEDENGTTITSGVAGIDDAAVVNYALSRSNRAVVHLAPNTTFTFNETIHIFGAGGTGSQSLIGGGDWFDSN